LLVGVFRAFVTTQGLITAAAGFNMAHYYLDSVIWRVRGDAGLAHALKL
jgi:hypothetical protein